MKRLTDNVLFVLILVAPVFGLLQLIYFAFIRTGDRGWYEGPSEAVIAPYNKMDQIIIPISWGIFLISIFIVLLNVSILLRNYLKSWRKFSVYDGISLKLYIKIVGISYLVIQGIIFYGIDLPMELEKF